MPADGAPTHKADERIRQGVGESVSPYCLHFAYYNPCRVHKTLHVTPAMEAGIIDHVWDLSELLA